VPGGSGTGVSVGEKVVAVGNTTFDVDRIGVGTVVAIWGVHPMARSKIRETFIRLNIIVNFLDLFSEQAIL
jgi:hypothetical protein